ncbi:hypothetical protein [Candidatus Thiothrix phosphatis]|uniref:hypothetical protein n=1 Tax=Candidatus Thiothrix phosphatis TaxID=3112415 RepID=UPI002D765832|nr:hypothetical protein [Candidatus Thiothrix sp. Deng01]
MHKTTPRFWACFDNLPAAIQELARKNFELLKQDPSHPSLRFKQVGELWSARVGIHYRALAVARMAIRGCGSGIMRSMTS